MLKGVVYKIYCRDSSITEFYVGSSCDFHKRKSSHKSICNNIKRTEYNFKVYKFIRNNGNWDNWDFEILLETEVDSKEELRLLYEREYIIELQPELNDRIEGRTPKEWREDNKEEIIEYKKEWRENNKEKIKEYYEDHKEKINTKNKKYYEDHKEEILQKAKEKFDCDCGGKYSYSGKTTHERTKKHQDFILSLSL